MNLRPRQTVARSVRWRRQIGDGFYKFEIRYYPKNDDTVVVVHKLEEVFKEVHRWHLKGRRIVDCETECFVEG